MELTTDPELYSPSIDNNGNYIDNISSLNMKYGIRCPCGSRKDKIYNTHSIFASHIKTNHHQKWLANLNLNKANYYVENEQLKNDTLNSSSSSSGNLRKVLNSKLKIWLIYLLENF